MRSPTHSRRWALRKLTCRRRRTASGRPYRKRAGAAVGWAKARSAVPTRLGHRLQNEDDRALAVFAGRIRFALVACRERRRSGAALLLVLLRLWFLLFLIASHLTFSHGVTPRFAC